MKQMRFGLITVLMMVFFCVSGQSLAQTESSPNVWGSAGLLAGVAQSGHINEAGGVLGGFGYGVQNKWMVGGEGYLFSGGGIKGSVLMANVGIVLDNWVQQDRYRRVWIPYVGFGTGSIESRQNPQQSDSGIFLSAGLQFRLKTERHSWGLRAAVMKSDGAPLWILGVTKE